MNQDLRALFKTAAEAIIEAEGIDKDGFNGLVVTFPRTLFMVVAGTIRDLKTEDRQELWREFPAILKELGLFVRKDRKKFEKHEPPPKQAITAGIMRGAQEADDFHRKILGNDY